MLHSISYVSAMTYVLVEQRSQKDLLPRLSLPLEAPLRHLPVLLELLHKALVGARRPRALRGERQQVGPPVRERPQEREQVHAGHLAANFATAIY